MAYGFNDDKSKFDIDGTVTDLTAMIATKANAGHKHSASDITSGTLSAARGGTGHTTLQATRNAMGLGSTTGALPIANGGTGETTALNALKALGMTVTTGMVTNVPAGGIKAGTVTLPIGGNVNDYVVVCVQQRGSASEAWDYAYTRQNSSNPLPYVSINADGELEIRVVNMNGSSARNIFYRLVLLKVA